MTQVFIAHSSKDDWLIDPIAKWLNAVGVTPYLSEIESPTPLPLPDKLGRAIKDSQAVFAILTKSVAFTQSTRDVVNWEIATAHAYGKSVYVFHEKGVEVPLMIQYISDYYTFDPLDQDALNRAMQKVYEIGIDIRRADDVGKAIALGLLILLGGLLLIEIFGNEA